MGTDRQLQILVIDDEGDILDILRQALGADGYRVQTAPTAAEGLQLYERQSNDIDLILLDFLLPDMTGDLVFECLQRINPNVRVILLTGCEDQVAKHLLDQGLRAYLPKPFFLEELLTRVRDEIEAV